MNIIVVVDNKWGIGKRNGLLFRLPKDMAFFKQQTVGKVVVMGANTFKSFPSGALPNRTNIVLDDSGQTYPDTITVDSVDKVFAELSRYDTENVYVIGGASFYKLMLPYCSKAYITKVNADGQAEVFFPDVDQMPDWVLQSSTQVTDGNYQLNFCTYVNNNVLNYNK